VTARPTTREGTMAERKTPRQRAQEEFDLAVRVLERAKARKAKVDAENEALVEKYERLAQEKRDEITKAAEDLKAAQRRVEFLGTHPDLNDDDDDVVGESPADDEDVL
jgi:hypothetical protein